MKNYKRNPATKILFLVAGLITFFIGLNLASTFTFGFGSKYVTLAIVLLAIGYFVFRIRKGNCCG